MNCKTQVAVQNPITAMSRDRGDVGDIQIT
jgi:hypothetical protein